MRKRALTLPKASLEQYLKWSQKYGKDLAFFRKMAEETGNSFPALEEQPELLVTDEYYLNAFYRLSSSRQLGMTTGPIPLSEIIGYLEYLNEPEPEEFIDIIQHCDGVYLDEVYKKQEAQSKSKK